MAYLEQLRWGDGFRCPGCDSTRSWPASRGLGSRVVRDLRQAHVGHRRHDLRRHPDTADPVVRRRLARVLDEERRLGARAADAARPGQLRDGVGVAAQVASGDGDPRPGPARPATSRSTRPSSAVTSRGCVRGRARGKKALVAVAVECRGSRSWSGPAGAHPRRQPGHAARVRHHQRRTRVDDAHRRLAALQGPRPSSAMATTPCRSAPRPRPPRSCCPASTVSPRCSSAGSTAPTKEQSDLSSSTTTSTSSPSASTAATHGPAGCCSTASCTRPSAPNPTPTPPSSRASRSVPPADHHPQHASTQDVVGTVTKGIAPTGG